MFCFVVLEWVTHRQHMCTFASQCCWSMCAVSEGCFEGILCLRFVLRAINWILSDVSSLNDHTWHQFIVSGTYPVVSWLFKIFVGRLLKYRRSDKFWWNQIEFIDASLSNLQYIVEHIETQHWTVLCAGNQHWPDEVFMNRSYYKMLFLVVVVYYLFNVFFMRILTPP